VIEVVRCCGRGWRVRGLRRVAELSGVGRKAARRYVEAAQAAGLSRDGGAAQVDDALVGAVVAAVRPARPAGHGAGWEACVAEHARIAAWVEQDVTATKIVELLERRGVGVPYRTLARYVVERCDGAAGRVRRSGSRTASRGWSARSTSPGWG